MSIKFLNGKVIRVISIVVVLIWIAIIFSLSAQPAEKSNKLSTGITKYIIRVIERVVPGLELDTGDLNHIARKSAHFFAYFILGILMVHALRRLGLSGYKVIILSIFICIILAIGDEIHQSFVPGRGPQVTDVLIDSAGSILGIGLCQIIARLMK